MKRFNKMLILFLILLIAIIAVGAGTIILIYNMLVLNDVIPTWVATTGWIIILVITINMIWGIIVILKIIKEIKSTH